MKRPLKCLSLTLVMFTLAVLISACTNTPNTSQREQSSMYLELEEIHPGILQGYLGQEQLPNSLALLSAPPVEGSAEWKLDQEKAEFFVNLEDEKRIAQAILDSDLSFPAALPAFSEVLPVAISEESTPHTYMLLRRSLADAGLST